jgi:hypothetical protein
LAVADRPEAAPKEDVAGVHLTVQLRLRLPSIVRVDSVPARFAVNGISFGFANSRNGFCKLLRTYIHPFRVIAP